MPEKLYLNKGVFYFNFYDCVVEKEDVAVPSHCHKFIERCLRVKNYDVEKASNLVYRNCYKLYIYCGILYLFLFSDFQ